MKHLHHSISFIIFLLFSSFTFNAMAQDASIIEPDTTASDLMYFVNTDNTLKALPMESGELKEHKNKFGSIASIVGTVADAAGALGGIGSIAGANSSSIWTMMTGIKVMGAAANVGDLANAANTLAGADGMDFTFAGSHSNFKVTPEGKDVRILVNVNCEKKEDGMSLFKVVRFASSKKDRRLQWLQTKAALINTDKASKAEKAGYLSFGFQSYGEHSCILSIPASELRSGEYGVFFLGNMITPTMTSLCYTFSID